MLRKISSSSACVRSPSMRFGAAIGSLAFACQSSTVAPVANVQTVVPPSGLASEVAASLSHDDGAPSDSRVDVGCELDEVPLMPLPVVERRDEEERVGCVSGRRISDVVLGPDLPVVPTAEPVDRIYTDEINSGRKDKDAGHRRELAGDIDAEIVDPLTVAGTDDMPDAKSVRTSIEPREASTRCVGDRIEQVDDAKVLFVALKRLCPRISLPVLWPQVSNVLLAVLSPRLDEVRIVARHGRLLARSRIGVRAKSSTVLVVVKPRENGRVRTSVPTPAGGGCISSHVRPVNSM